MSRPDPIATYLRTQYRRIVENQPRARAGDPDGVHDMRVALRRTRATLRTFRRLLDSGRTEPVRAELGWLAGLLGGVRDSEVQYSHLIARLEALDVPDAIGPVRARLTEHFTARTAGAREALLTALDSERYRTLLDRTGQLDSLVLADPPAAKLRRQARKALDRADAALTHALNLPRRSTGLGSPGSPSRDVALHDARKAYKRARYAVEAVATGRGGRRLGRRLADLQDVLGDHQDGVLATALMRELGVRAHVAGENAFAYGVIRALEAEHADKRMQDLPSMRRRASRRRVRAVLD